MTRNRFTAVMLALLLLCAVGSSARAWPEQPPDKAFVSGPGIGEREEIRDVQVLQALRLGGLEDMAHGVIPLPRVNGEGFKIIRYFEGGSFRYADLTYYPNVEGARGVVYFQDGPDVQGDRSPFHEKWLYATSDGERIVRSYLANMGGVLPAPHSASDKPSKVNTAKVDGLPLAVLAGKPVTLGFTLAQSYKVVPVAFRRAGATERVVVAASASGAEGHYLLTHVFPSAGTWEWSVRATYNDPEIPMPAINVVQAQVPAPPVAAQPVEPVVQPAPVETVIPAQELDPVVVALAAAAAGIGILGVGRQLTRRSSKGGPK
jgi:hypothetical protein